MNSLKKEYQALLTKVPSNLQDTFLVIFSKLQELEENKDKTEVKEPVKINKK